jgi:hypothetical protein
MEDKQPKNTWKRVYVARATHVGDTRDDILYELHAERSDGVDFRFQFMVLKDAVPKDIVLQFCNGLLDLDTYRDCDCVVGTPCKQHAGVPNPYAPRDKRLIVM